MARQRDHARLEQSARHLQVMNRIEKPSAAVLELDGFVWRPALSSDAGTLDELASQHAHRLLFALPASRDDFASRIGEWGFRLPMLCTCESRPVGAAATSMRNNRSLNLQLLCFFAQPEIASLALAIYVRHVFWSLPMHRIYVQMPLVPGADPYVQLLRSIGFQDEGVVRGHALIDGRTYDVTALGMLRKEFEAWCLQNENRLTL